MRAMATQVVQLPHLLRLLLSFPPCKGVRGVKHYDIYVRIAAKILQYLREARSAHSLPLPTLSFEMRHSVIKGKQKVLVEEYKDQRVSGLEAKGKSLLEDDEDKTKVEVSKGKNTGRKRKRNSAPAAEDQKRKGKGSAPDDEWLPEHHRQDSSDRETKRKR
jgi:hypothetical protein